MRKVNRVRDKVITVRMNADEYSTLQKKVVESGLSKQTYIINAISGATITPAAEINELMEISKTFADVERQLRGLATNINQMAHVANGQGFLPTETELDNISDEIKAYRMESEQLWQSIRSLIGKHRHTEQ